VKKANDMAVPDGIIAHLARSCGGNVHSRSVVEVTGSEGLSGDIDYAPMKAVEFSTGQAFVSSTVPDGLSDSLPHAAWLC
jgi:hypothetical protein